MHADILIPFLTTTKPALVAPSIQKDTIIPLFFEHKS